MTRDLIFEVATDRDIDAIVELERRGWPQAGSMQADRDRFCRRIALGGMIVARLGAGGTLVGAISTFRPPWIHPGTLDEMLGGCPDELLRFPGNSAGPRSAPAIACPATGMPRPTMVGWAAARGTTPTARLYSGSGSPQIRESDSAASLRRCSTARWRSHAGRGRGTFWRTARLPMYSLHASDTPEQYVSRTVQRDGVVKPFDFGFRLHWAGAKPLRSAGGPSRYIVIPGSMPDDAESLTCGVLVMTPLGDRSVFPFEAAIAA